MVCVFFCGSFRFGKNRHRSTWYFGDFSFGCLYLYYFLLCYGFPLFWNDQKLPAVLLLSGDRFLHRYLYAVLSRLSGRKMCFLSLNCQLLHLFWYFALVLFQSQAH